MFAWTQEGSIAHFFFFLFPPMLTLKIFPTVPFNFRFCVQDDAFHDGTDLRRRMVHLVLPHPGQVRSYLGPDARENKPSCSMIYPE